MATESESEAAAQVRRWRSPLLVVTIAGFACALLSGSVLLFAGGWLENRDAWSLVHWALALVAMVPYAVYQRRHFLRVGQYARQTHYRAGLHTAVAIGGTFLTGLPLIGPLARGTSFHTAVDLAHMFFGFVFAILLSAHLTLVALITVSRVPPDEAAIARVAVRNLLALAAGLALAVLLVAARAG